MHAGMWVALLSGIAVAASCGLRAFLPLLVLGLAARAGLIELHEGVRWLASDLTLTALWVATIVEIAADKIPVVDHALDAVATVLRPAAAWLASYAVLAGWPTPWAQIAALVLGTVAFTVHGFKASLRLGSTATTLGVGNVFLSLLDDLLASLLLATALFGAVALLAAIPVFIWARSRRRAVVATDGNAAAPLAPNP